MVSYMDYTSPDTQFTYDLSNNRFYTKDANNYINALTIKQLNTLGNTSLLDIFLSKGNVVEPHYHQNASELVYCISGAAVVSIINPFTNELMNFPITPGQVANVPQGWWHYEAATVDHTHLLAVFDAPVAEVILGSDLLRLTPPEVLAYTYCLNEKQVRETLAPMPKSLFIGPPSHCQTPNSQVQGVSAQKPMPNMTVPNQQMNQSVPNQTVPAPAYNRQQPYIQHRQQPVYPAYPYAHAPQSPYPKY